MSRESKRQMGQPKAEDSSRREFLKTVGLGNVALGLGTLGLGGVVLGQEPEAAAADSKGSLIGAVRLDPVQAYGEVPLLLERYVKTGDAAAWADLKKKIDYVYGFLGHSLRPVLKKNNLKHRIKAEIKAGRKLFFKPNIVAASVFSDAGDGSPGWTTGLVAATPWQFMAALLRFFHEELGVRYYQMAVGEAGVSVPCMSAAIGCPGEAVMEGGGIPMPDGGTLWAGYPFFFARKYLSESTKALDPLDDAMSGFSDSAGGTYVTPGEATRQGKLIFYELNNAERDSRGRLVLVPDGGDNYPEGIVLHKALVGDPGDTDNYPGSVLINCPVLKVHCNSILTNAIKNLGIGGWPMRAGKDSDPSSHDWLYAFPHGEPPGMKGGVPGGPNKGGVYHARWYVRKVNDEGMPLEIAESPNQGLDGTMVDIDLAIRSQVALWLHVVDAIRPVNFEHGGTGTGVAVDEGLVFASEDPVAVDLLCARYLFKSVPRDPSSPSIFERPMDIPRYDAAEGAIVSGQSAMDARVSRSKLFAYASYRKLGQTAYHVEGVDKTAPGSPRLATKDGHFGRVMGGRFEDLVTREFYYDVPKILWDLQPMVLAHARATDELTLATQGYDPGYHDEFMALDENGDGIVDDTESGKAGLWDCMCAGGGISDNLVGNGKARQGGFHAPSRILKFAEKAWNRDAGTGRSVDTMRICMDTQIGFNTALTLAKGEPGTDTFFDIPYGTGADGVARWPSLQYARHASETGMIRGALYPQAKAYAEETNQDFTLWVPDKAPYWPSASYNPDGLPNIVEISDEEFLPGGAPNPKYDPEFKAKVFTAWFESGEKW